MLQAYAQLFDAVEVNSTFYRIPKLATAQKWLKEATDIKPTFLFTVKAYQGITHQARFGMKALGELDSIKQVAEALAAQLLLFQSPASFKPTLPNIKKMKSFFSQTDRGKLIFAWEPRGSWFDEVNAIAEVCEESSLLVCVDPFRNVPMFLAEKSIAYFRVHGLGRQSMYRYNFSKEELQQLAELVLGLPQIVKTVYLFFNNMFCYENALQFSDLIKA